MLGGVCLTLLTGLVWGGIGVLISRVARGGTNLIRFYASLALFGMPLAWCVFPAYDRLSTAAWASLWPLALLMLAAGGAGQAGMLLLSYAMRAGHNGMAWSIGQSALVVPFVAGLCVFGGGCRWWQAAGVLLLVASLFSFGRTQKRPAADCAAGSRSSASAWFFLALAGFACLGTEQTLKTAASVYPLFRDAYGLRVPLATLGGGMLMLALASLCGRWPHKRELGTAFLLVAAGQGGQWLLYRALDALAREDAAAIAFPIAVGTCILSFNFYSLAILRETAPRAVKIGLALGLAGVVCVALR